MYKIMFICHGNICRSPMAEFLMKDLVEKSGRNGEFFIDSCAVSHETVWNGQGEPVYPPAKALLSSLGIDCSAKRSKVLTEKDGEEFDLFLCMDDSNVARAKRILGKNGVKCKKLLAYAGENRDVADPWYTRDFQTTYRDIMRGLTGLLEMDKGE